MMIWMLCTIAFSALVALSARLVELALPPQWPRRHVWTGATLASLLVPALALLTGGRLPGVAFATRPALEFPDVLTTWSGDVGAAALTVESVSPGWSLGLLLAGGWLVLTVVLLCGYAAIWLRFIGSATEWRSGRLCGHRVRVAARVGPAVFGLWRPVIVVPEWVLAADPAVQHLVVLHEVEHTRARDHILLGLAPLALVAVPWNLPLWWQIRRLRLATELDCDRRVLRRGVPTRDYGTLLIDIAGRSDRLPAALAAFGGPRTSLERRIIAMSTRTPSHWRARAAVLAATAALVLVTALESFAVMAPPAAVQLGPEATAPDAARAPVLDAVRAEFPERLAPMTADTPIVVIDGVIVRDRDVERTISGATIASIEMVRGAEAVRRFGERAAGGVLLITTALPGVVAPAVTASPATIDAETAARAEATARRIRVEAAASATRNPLYVINGVLSASAVDIDPDDIESIEVIKGPAAEQLYGERAAGGVIRITTKKSSSFRCSDCRFPAGLPSR